MNMIIYGNNFYFQPNYYYIHDNQERERLTNNVISSLKFPKIQHQSSWSKKKKKISVTKTD